MRGSLFAASASILILSACGAALRPEVYDEVGASKEELVEQRFEERPSAEEHAAADEIRKQLRLVENTLAALKAPNTEAWQESVKQLLLDAYDRDRSLALDTSAELKLIPCSVFRVLDERVKATPDGFHGLKLEYGFSEYGRTWQGHLLGFVESERDSAAARMDACRL